MDPTLCRGRDQQSSVGVFLSVKTGRGCATILLLNWDNYERHLKKDATKKVLDLILIGGGASIKNTIQLYREPIAWEESFDMSHVSAAALRNTRHFSTVDRSLCDVSPVPDVVARNTALASRSNCVMVATSSISKNTHLKLLEFLQNVETSKWIKGRIEDYFHWLDKEDVKSIADLQEAVHDDEYLKNDLHEGNWVVGIKGFKRWKFKELVFRQLWWLISDQLELLS